MIQCKHEQDENKDGPFSDETIKAVILDMFLAGKPFIKAVFIKKTSKCIHAAARTKNDIYQLA